MSHHAVGLHDNREPRSHLVFSSDTCAECPTHCAEACFNDAIRRSGASIIIDPASCAGCGGCIGACRHARIALVQGVARLRP